MTSPAAKVCMNVCPTVCVPPAIAPVWPAIASLPAHPNCYAATNRPARPRGRCCGRRWTPAVWATVFSCPSGCCATPRPATSTTTNARIGGTAWFADALDELTVPHRRLPGPLIRHRPPPGAHPLHRPADYLEQHARTERTLDCPPASFWDAAVRHAHTPDEFTVLRRQAEIRGRYRHAVHCHQRASAAGDPYALAERRNGAGDRESAAQLHQQAAGTENTNGRSAAEPNLTWPDQPAPQPAPCRAPLS